MNTSAANSDFFPPICSPSSAARDTRSLTWHFPYLPQRSTPNFGVTNLKIHHIFLIVSTAAAITQSMSYGTPWNMAHSLRTHLCCSSFWKLPLSLILWVPSHQISLCSDASAPDRTSSPPPEVAPSPSALFSKASTTLSECARHVFFLFLLLEHTLLRAGMVLSFVLTILLRPMPAHSEDSG